MKTFCSLLSVVREMMFMKCHQRNEKHHLMSNLMSLTNLTMGWISSRRMLHPYCVAFAKYWPWKKIGQKRKFAYNHKMLQGSISTTVGIITSQKSTFVKYRVNIVLCNLTNFLLILFYSFCWIGFYVVFGYQCNHRLHSSIIFNLISKMRIYPLIEWGREVLLKH